MSNRWVVIEHVACDLVSARRGPMTRLRDLDPAAVVAAAASALAYARTGRGSPGDADALRLVLTAAEGRSVLERGEPVTTGQLAALGSVTDRYVRRLVGDGRLGTVEHEGSHARVPAAVALAWLASVEAAAQRRAVPKPPQAPKRPRGRPRKHPVEKK